MKKINEIPKIDRPREKIKFKGAKSLSDFELLLALIGSGNKQTDVTKIAKEVKKLLQTDGINISYEQLKLIKGLGDAKIAELLAAFELSKRYLIESDKPMIKSAEDAAQELSDIRNKKQEYFVCMTLDGANRLIAKRTITIGTLNASLSHPREVFADAIVDRAAAIIVAHNHPSGTLRPSESDQEITRKLINSGKMLGILLLDHVIITRDKYFSFAENGLLKENGL